MSVDWEEYGSMSMKGVVSQEMPSPAMEAGMLCDVVRVCDSLADG